MYSKASLTRSPNSFRWYSNDSASGCTWITTEDVWSADSQTLNANSLGSCSSTSPNMSADHAAYASALPGLIRDLLIMMNGPDIGSPSTDRTLSTLGAGARARHPSYDAFPRRRSRHDRPPDQRMLIDARRSFLQ